jgi:hypothetical protein
MKKYWQDNLKNMMVDKQFTLTLVESNAIITFIGSNVRGMGFEPMNP